MNWTVETLNQDVDRELEALPKSLKARFIRIAEVVEQLGLERVGAPHIKHLEGKLWEMRMKGPEGIARAIYVAVRGKRVVIVHAFTKKTQKTPRKALEIARRRAAEISS